MNRLPLRVSLLVGLALAAAIEVRPAAADSVRVPIRSANARTRQLDPNAVPAPAPPVPLPTAPLPGQPALPPSVGGPLPPQPVPDPPPPTPLAPTPSAPNYQPSAPRYQPPPAPGGGAMYHGPLGADYQPSEVNKRQFLGDQPGSVVPPAPGEPVPVGPLPSIYGPPGANANPGVASGPTAGTDPYGVAPPPGTLGQTYQRRTRLIDAEKHPRVGMVDVALSDNYEVTSKGLKVKWTGKVWRLESDPLLPGIPHIYEVKSEWGPEGAKQHQVRTIRLIPGRIVDLEF